MAEKSSGSPKRTTRPRRTTKASAGDDSHVSRPAIEDAFEEAAAARADFDAPPTERDMDFETLEAPAPRKPARPRTRKAAVAAETVEPAAPPNAPAEREPAERAPAPRAERARPEREPPISYDTVGFGSDDNEGPSGGDADREAPRAENGAPRAEGGDSGDSGAGDDGRRPRRRRRRRRGGDQPASGGQAGGHNAGGGSHHHQQPPRGGGGGRNQRGGQPHGQRRGGGGGYQGGQGGQRQSNYNNQPNYNAPPRADLPGEPVQGLLELHPKGYGFLRDAKANYASQESDAFVSSTLIEKHKLREGVWMTGECVSGGRGQGPRLRSVDTIDGRTLEAYAEVKSFDELTPINPHEQIVLETGSTPITMRVMDLLTPIAKGQRALIVAPPRTGKTMLLQDIADSVAKNHPEIYLMVLLIDERPEEVTEMQRRVRGEVIASSLDRELESHIRVSQLVFERAKRMAEEGRDVFVLLDSITRTARAFNKWSNSGRTGTGGLDIRAMDLPKKMFGNARQFEEGGSLTIAGTALIETGSRMDDAIFQEFKGTGNMELVLSRDLADRRIWPAIDITRSGTRREEKILSPEILEGVTLLRRSLISMSPVEAMEQLTRILAKYPSNAEFLAKIRSIM